MKHDEYKLQKSICAYLNMQYPDVLYMSDSSSNVKLTMFQSARLKAINKADFSVPDMFIFQPNAEFKGLALELKVENPYTKGGELKKQKVTKKNKSGVIVEVYDHLQEQERSLRRLRQVGYKAEFVWTLEMAIDVIKDYMRTKS